MFSIFINIYLWSKLLEKWSLLNVWKKKGEGVVIEKSKVDVFIVYGITMKIWKCNIKSNKRFYTNWNKNQFT